jgi:hypothetical protein
MTYAAELNEQDEVIRVIVGDYQWATNNLGGRWVDTPKCGPGWLYIDGQIVPPSPYPSWLLNESTGLWEAPVPYPDGDNLYIWDEELQAWVEVDDLRQL